MIRSHWLSDCVLGGYMLRVDLGTNVGRLSDLSLKETGSVPCMWPTSTWVTLTVLRIGDNKYLINNHCFERAPEMTNALGKNVVCQKNVAVAVQNCFVSHQISKLTHKCILALCPQTGHFQKTTAEFTCGASENHLWTASSCCIWFNDLLQLNSESDSIALSNDLFLCSASEMINALGENVVC